MSTHPTSMSPWYVVQRFTYENVGLGDLTHEEITGLEFYTALDSGSGEFTKNKLYAVLFDSLASAARVASGATAEIRVLTTEKEKEEFGR